VPRHDDAAQCDGTALRHDHATQYDDSVLGMITAHNETVLF